MRYKDMILANQNASEETMIKTVDRVDKLLEEIKESEPDRYWRFIRQAHEDMYGCHYDSEFANYDVSNLRYTGRDEVEHQGGYWTKSETTSVTQTITFPEGTTQEDIYVALNVMYADLCKILSDEQIVNVACVFFFDDEDAPEGKIWRYMKAMTKKC